MEPETTYLERTIYYGDYDELAAIISEDPSVVNYHFRTNFGLTPLMWACRNRRDSMVELLLDSGADINLVDTQDDNGQGGNTAPWYTAQGSATGNVMIAKMLLDSGADIDQRCEFNMTALFVAASWLHLDLVQFLIERGANFTSIDCHGMTIVDMLQADLARISKQSHYSPDEQRYLESTPRIIRYFEKL